MTSFYLAASSKPEHAALVAACQRSLEELGLVNAYDWTTNLQDPPEKFPELAVRDIIAAQEADVFVYLADTKSMGGMLELGVRLGAGRVSVCGTKAIERKPASRTAASGDCMVGVICT